MMVDGRRYRLRSGILPTRGCLRCARNTRLSLEAASNSHEVNDPAYERDYFKTLITISGTCNTREYVLKRDGTNVVTSSACTATSGTWYSDYDGATWIAASDVDIDHIVPLVCAVNGLISNLCIL
jgi:hypothetical protein